MLGGTTFKVGKFLTTAGAEYIPSHENANFSRSFLFGNAIPFTHTGVIAETELVAKEGEGSLLSMALGYSNGWDQARNTNDGHIFLTSTTLAPAEFFDVTVNWFFGWRDARGIGDDRSFSHLIDIVSTIKIPEVDGLSLVLNLDWYGDEDHSAGAYASYYGFAGVVQWDIDNPFTEEVDKNFMLAFRGEYFDDDTGFLRSLGALAGTAGNTAGDLWDLTWTVGYKPADSLLIRAEVRYDKANGAIFENSTRSHQTTFALNTVFTF